MELKNFKDIKGFIEFNHGCDKVLKDTLKEFFSAEVCIIDSPLVRLKEHSIDVADTPKRNLYILDKDTIFLLCFVEDNDARYYLGIEISAENISTLSNPRNLNPRLFHITANAISNSLEEARKSRFRKCIVLVNENLIKRIITKYLTPGSYNPYKIYFLIERFIAIRDTTFEGKYFSTGLIVSKSKHLYEKLPKDKCALFELNTSENIFAPVERRFWYIADGYSSFYYATLKTNVRDLLVINEKIDNYIEKILLSNYLKGEDFLIRTHNGREMSVIMSDGIEFLYQENIWRLRDYNWIKDQILSVIAISDEVFYAIMYHVLQCSKNDISSIVWIPKDTSLKGIEKFVKTKNSLTRPRINVKAGRNEQLISRVLSSDGATVFSSEGYLLYYGCIVDNEAIENCGVKGTGESAASTLAQNGIAFKISQDGMIKLFLSGRDQVIKF